MAEDQTPFADVTLTTDGFTLPELKWRELLFTGAIRVEGERFARDSTRPLPAFEREGLFPAGTWFRVTRQGRRVRLHRLSNV